MHNLQSYVHQGLFQLESGENIADLQIVYQTYGALNKKKSNVIWVFHAISGSTDVLDWWSGLFGENTLYDPSKYFIICANTIGSPYGSTKPNDFDFPIFTVRDVVNAHFLLAKKLNIDNVHTAIGGSFGGYQALEFSYAFTGQIEHLIILASSAKESAWGIAIHESQRMALEADISFGESDAGVQGMKAARAIAMLTYRTPEDLIKKQTDQDNQLDNFKASSYMNYQGEKFSKRFDALCYFYLTKCIDSHNIGRGRGGEVQALQAIQIPTLVIGFTTDTLVPVRFQKSLAENIPNAFFSEFNSEYGHDGFLKEVEKVSNSIETFYSNVAFSVTKNKRVILKFGGTSLYSNAKLEKVLSIVKEAKQADPLAIVVSARGKSTDWLIDLFNLASAGKDFSQKLEAFKIYNQSELFENFNEENIEELEKVLNAIQLLRDDSESAYDRVLAFGELMSAKNIARWLSKYGLRAKFVDARKMIFTNIVMDSFEVDIEKSRNATQQIFSKLDNDEIAIIPGFIATSEKTKTVTLGRNGSNYTASLIASFIRAKEVQNWTDVNGIYSANPQIVDTAERIDTMTYREANEMANFGMHLLHPKAIAPLIHSKIPLRIKFTSDPEDSGTLINHNGEGKRIKAVTTIDDVSMVTIEGNELSQKIGIDARIFNCLSVHKISIKMVSQASSERGIGFVISNKDAKTAELALNEEFKHELRLQQISNIRVNNEIGIIAIIGRHNYALEKAISVLRKNSIWMYLISNSISGEHISLVINRNALRQAVQLVHNEIFTK